MPTEKKTQPSCPGSRDLNWTGKGLMCVCQLRVNGINQKASFYDDLEKVFYHVPIAHINIMFRRI
jgi:hypothetical protein